MKNVLVMSVAELWLKGRNQKRYVDTLRSHIKQLLKIIHKDKISYVIESHNHIISSESEFSEEAFKALSKVPGIASLYRAETVESDLQKIIDKSIELISHIDKKDVTFKVVAKRNNKSFSHNSMMIEREVGHHILNKFSELKVDIKKPQLKILIKVMSDFTIVSHSFQAVSGIGGLPVGTTGKMLSLLSGGFDSPVASYLMNKRGVNLDYVFFYAYPFIGEDVKEKIIKIFKQLSLFQRKSSLYIVPIGNLQKEISKHCREDYRTFLFRYYMLKLATELAPKLQASALVTGDSLGQVSSQTLEGITQIDRLTPITILRPLIGFNKNEVISLAQEIGTHDISVIPHDDACALFAPKHPVTKPHTRYIDNFLKEHDFSDLCSKAIEEMDVITSF